MGKQSDYLSVLLNEALDAPSPAPSPAQAVAGRADSAVEAPVKEPNRGGMTLLSRESALARVATGEVKQITQLLLDPARVRIWAGNARHQGSLSEESCRDLIDAILAEGGQKVPAIVRRVTGDERYDYEVVAGSRRHWAISWLRANNYPDMMFLAQVYPLDDEAAFRISDIENRARKDVSDFERARVYLQALSTHYNGKQVRMAERLRLSKGWLSKMLTVGALPDWVIKAFASPADIQLKVCYPLAQKIQALIERGDKEAVAHMRRVADMIAAEQAGLRNSGRPALPAADVLSRLTRVRAAPSQDGPIRFDMASGRTALSVLSSNRNGVSLRLHASSGATPADLARMLTEALEALERQGKGLRL